MKKFKRMKKLLAVMLAAIMVLAMGVVSVSADTGTYTITITNKNQSEVHTYEAYQIFKGDVSGDVLVDITWGGNVNYTTEVNGYTLLAALKADTTYGSYFNDCNSAADVAAVLSTNNTNNALAERFALIVNDYLTGTPEESTGGTSGSYTITVNMLLIPTILMDQLLEHQRLVQLTCIHLSWQ